MSIKLTDTQLVLLAPPRNATIGAGESIEGHAAM